MWVLIMTVYLGRGYNVYPTMTVIQNFESNLLCLYAGAQQEVVLRTSLKLNTSDKYDYICVQQKVEEVE